jgi:cytochrome c oxidase cbb3-type subunit 3
MMRASMLRRVALTVAFTTALTVAFVTTACDGAPGKPDPADAYVRPSEVMAFDALYATNCSGCHGADGTHGPALALANPVYLAWAPRDALRAAIANGVAGTGMPAFARSQGGWLTDTQIDAIVDGAIAKWGSMARESDAPLPAYTQSGGDAARGAVAFREYCASCHGPDGAGTAKGSAIVQPEYLALVSDQALRSTIVVGRPDLAMPGWRALDADSNASNPMSAEQVDDVVAWLASFRSEP